jgi:hypothetical protein
MGSWVDRSGIRVSVLCGLLSLTRSLRVTSTPYTFPPLLSPLSTCACREGRSLGDIYSWGSSSNISLAPFVTFPDPVNAKTRHDCVCTNRVRVRFNGLIVEFEILFSLLWTEPRTFPWDGSEGEGQRWETPLAAIW